MDFADIQQAIEALPVEQQTALLDWLAERESAQWDSEIERDFSPGGRGMNLFNRVKDQVARGESTAIAQARQRR